MTVDLTGAFADAWAMWKRDRELLLAIAGLFLFLPQLALLLLVPEAPGMPPAGSAEATIATWIDQTIAWYGDHGLALIAANLLALFGGVTVLVLYLGGARPDLKAALGMAAALLPRYILAGLLALVPVMLGMILIVPGIYAQGRLMLVGPALVAERPLPAVDAIRRSINLTYRRGLAMFALACLILFGGQFLALPFLALGGTLDGAPVANPVSALLIDACAAAALAAAALATVLLRIAVYRRLLESSRGT